ncbi:unnamed protein product [Arctogadus glacialis]
MKFSSALLLLTSAVLGVGPSSGSYPVTTHSIKSILSQSPDSSMPDTMRAISLESLDAITDLTMGMQQQKIRPITISTIRTQGEPQYFEVGTTLTLEPDVSTVPQPINSIRWRYGTNLAVDWDSSSSTYYGSFRGRITLDPLTLRLDINRLTLADSGQFSLETNHGTVGTHEVKVIKPPPTPRIKAQPLVCEFPCALKCTADTQDLGPFSYEWKKDEGEWTEGDVLKNISSSDTPEKFSCRLKTPVRTSEASIAKDNPLYKPPDGLTFGDIFGIRIGIFCVVAVIAVITVISLVKCRPGDGELGK